MHMAHSQRLKILINTGNALRQSIPAFLFDAR